MAPRGRAPKRRRTRQTEERQKEEEEKEQEKLEDEEAEAEAEAEEKEAKEVAAADDEMPDESTEGAGRAAEEEATGGTVPGAQEGSLLEEPHGEPIEEGTHLGQREAEATVEEEVIQPEQLEQQQQQQQQQQQTEEQQQQQQQQQEENVEEGSKTIAEDHEEVGSDVLRLRAARQQGAHLVPINRRFVQPRSKQAQQAAAQRLNLAGASPAEAKLREAQHAHIIARKLERPRVSLVVSLFEEFFTIESPFDRVAQALPIDGDISKLARRHFYSDPTVAHFLRCIEMGRLDIEFVDFVESAGSGLPTPGGGESGSLMSGGNAFWYDGCIIVEVRNYRGCQPGERPPLSNVFRTRMRPTDDVMMHDMTRISQLPRFATTRIWTSDDLQQLYSKAMLIQYPPAPAGVGALTYSNASRSPPTLGDGGPIQPPSVWIPPATLCLHPDPSVADFANFIHFNDTKYGAVSAAETRLLAHEPASNIRKRKRTESAAEATGIRTSSTAAYFPLLSQLRRFTGAQSPQPHELLHAKLPPFAITVHKAVNQIVNKQNQLALLQRKMRENAGGPVSTLRPEAHTVAARLSVKLEESSYPASIAYRAAHEPPPTAYVAQLAVKQQRQQEDQRRREAAVNDGENGDEAREAETVTQALMKSEDDSTETQLAGKEETPSQRPQRAAARTVDSSTTDTSMLDDVQEAPSTPLRTVSGEDSDATKSDATPWRGTDKKSPSAAAKSSSTASPTPPSAAAYSAPPPMGPLLRLLYQRRLRFAVHGGRTFANFQVLQRRSGYEGLLRIGRVPDRQHNGEIVRFTLGTAQAAQSFMRQLRALYEENGLGSMAWDSHIHALNVRRNSEQADVAAATHGAGALLQSPVDEQT